MSADKAHYMTKKGIHGAIKIFGLPFLEPPGRFLFLIRCELQTKQTKKARKLLIQEHCSFQGRLLFFSLAAQFPCIPNLRAKLAFLKLVLFLVPEVRNGSMIEL